MERNLRKTRTGKVIIDYLEARHNIDCNTHRSEWALMTLDKKIVAAMEAHVKHPLYKKIVKETYKLKAHDENNECKIGDTVKVMETRPLSKDKRWRLVEIIERAK